MEVRRSGRGLIGLLSGTAQLVMCSRYVILELFVEPIISGVSGIISYGTDVLLLYI